MKRISHERFIGLLDRQLSALEAVRELLDREAQALQAGRIRLVEAMRARKQRRLAAAAVIEQQRRERVPTPAALELLAESKEVATRWAALLELTRVCRDLSEANASDCRQQQARTVSSGLAASRHARTTSQSGGRITRPVRAATPASIGGRRGR
jgi:flagellar biosynthesis/type III secretory pathway chaperone